MSDVVNIESMTLAELQALEQKIKKSEFYAALGIGIFVGVLVFNLFVGGNSMVAWILSIIFIATILKHSKANKAMLKKVRERIENNE